MSVRMSEPDCRTWPVSDTFDGETVKLLERPLSEITRQWPVVGVWTVPDASQGNAPWQGVSHCPRHCNIIQISNFQWLPRRPPMSYRPVIYWLEPGANTLIQLYCTALDWHCRVILTIREGPVLGYLPSIRNAYPSGHSDLWIRVKTTTDRVCWK